jgi:hypothetical protein
MTGPLIFFIIAIIALPFSIYLTFKTDHPFFVLGSMILGASFICCVFFPVKTAYEPIVYKAESTSFKVFAITDEKVFESDKKIDFHNWTSGKEGYLYVEYNSFGSIITKSFTTEKPENEK